MRKVILIILLSLVTSIVLAVIGYYVYFRLTYEPYHEPYYERLSHSDRRTNFMRSLLKKLKYKTANRLLDYDKDKFNAIYLNYYIDEDNSSQLLEWKEWVTEGKRLIVVFIYPDNPSDYFMLSAENFDNIQTSAPDTPLMEDVEALYLRKFNVLNHDLTDALTAQAEPLVESEEGIYVAKESYRGGEIIYIADRHIFANLPLFKADNGLFLNNLLKKYHKEKIVFDWVSNTPPEKETELPFFLMASFPYILLQLLILALIFFLTFFKRFGAAIDRDRYRKRSITRHLEAVGYFYQKSNNPENITNIFDGYFIERLRSLLRFRSTDEKSVTEELKKRYNLQGDEEKILAFNDTENITEVQIERELFIKKLRKGIYGK